MIAFLKPSIRWILVGVLCFSGASASAQDVDPLRIESPEAVVRSYIQGVKKGDLLAVAKTYTEPLEKIYTALHKFHVQHLKLIKRADALFGKEGAKVVDEKKYRVSLPRIVDGTVHDGEAKAGKATVPVDLLLKGIKDRRRMTVHLRWETTSWRITQVGGTPLPIPMKPEASVMEWRVAEEATRRSVEFLSRNKVKAAADIPTLRDSYLPIVTREFDLKRKLEGRKPTSRPTSRPSSRPKESGK